jgi:hypothetical protein
LIQYYPIFNKDNYHQKELYNFKKVDIILFDDNYYIFSIVLLKINAGQENNTINYVIDLHSIIPKNGEDMKDQEVKNSFINKIDTLQLKLINSVHIKGTGNECYIFNNITKNKIIEYIVSEIGYKQVNDINPITK